MGSQRIRLEKPVVQDWQAVRRIDLERRVAGTDADACCQHKKPVDAVPCAGKLRVWKAKVIFVPEVDTRLILRFHHDPEIGQHVINPRLSPLFGLFGHGFIVEAEDVVVPDPCLGLQA